MNGWSIYEIKKTDTKREYKAEDTGYGISGVYGAGVWRTDC
jgi:hypothetical protein